MSQIKDAATIGGDNIADLFVLFAVFIILSIKLFQLTYYIHHIVYEEELMVLILIVYKDNFYYIYNILILVAIFYHHIILNIDYIMQYNGINIAAKPNIDDIYEEKYLIMGLIIKIEISMCNIWDDIIYNVLYANKNNNNIALHFARINHIPLQIIYKNIYDTLLTYIDVKIFILIVLFFIYYLQIHCLIPNHCKFIILKLYKLN